MAKATSKYEIHKAQGKDLVIKGLFGVWSEATPPTGVYPASTALGTPTLDYGLGYDRPYHMGLGGWHTHREVQEYLENVFFNAGTKIEGHSFSVLIGGAKGELSGIDSASQVWLVDQKIQGLEIAKTEFLGGLALSVTTEKGDKKIKTTEIERGDEKAISRINQLNQFNIRDIAVQGSRRIVSPFFRRPRINW